MVPDLRDDLLAWIRDDDEIRERLARDGRLFDGYATEMELVHRRNAERLDAVIAQHGWPGRTLVGEDAASAAWRIVQHAIGEPARMRAWLPLLADAAARGEADPAEVAMLDDRIRVLEGRSQRYGTQYDWDATCTQMALIGAIEEPATVDARRAAVGLPPIEWTRPAPPDEPPPRDPAARAREQDAWARRVGWR